MLNAEKILQVPRTSAEDLGKRGNEGVVELAKGPHRIRVCEVFRLGCKVKRLL